MYKDGQRAVKQKTMSMMAFVYIMGTLAGIQYVLQAEEDLGITV